jgi:hypothetical protein
MTPGGAEPLAGDTSSIVAEELRAVLETAPSYGTAGLVLVFHDGCIVRIERSRSEMRKRY